MAPSPTPTGLSGDESRDALQRYIDMERSVLFHALSVADAKAGFALAISLGLALVQLPHLPAILRAGALSPAHALTLIAELCLALSGAAAFAAVFPRTAASHDAIDIFWRSAGFLRPPAEFVERYARGLCGDTLRDDQLRHLHVSARICRRKYLSVTVAMAAIPLGFVLLVLGVLLE